MMARIDADDLLRAVDAAVSTEWTTTLEVLALVEGGGSLGVQDVAWALRTLRRDGLVERRTLPEGGHVWRQVLRGWDDADA